LLTSKIILLVSKINLSASKINLPAGKNNLQASKWLGSTHFAHDFALEREALPF